MSSLPKDHKWHNIHHMSGLNSCENGSIIKVDERASSFYIKLNLNRINKIINADQRASPFYIKLNLNRINKIINVDHVNTDRFSYYYY